ncbi:S-layer homology domain [Peptoniphilus sp. ING2-D1G]|nr:S-layer homology domain [Peptoniphilus sp. ING2-D1G]
MKKMSGITLFFCLMLLFSLFITNTSYAAEDILVVLEQPAVYKANKGDELNYRLNVELPEDYQSKYRSFAVTVLVDDNLKVNNAVFRGIKPIESKITLNVTEIKDNTQNLVTLSVNETEFLGGVNKFSVDISAEVREDADGNTFENSFVLAYVDRKGVENSVQKNLTSNTKVETGQLVLNSIYSNFKYISGKTSPGAEVSLLKGDEVINTSKATEDGSFQIAINPQETGTKLIVRSKYLLEGKEYFAEEISVVKDAEDKYISAPMIDDSLKSNARENMQMLDDYVRMSKSLNTSKSTREDSARLVAAIANGQYIQVKSDVTNSEISAAINAIKEAVSFIRKPIMKGYANGTFGPEKDMTRAEVAFVLAKIDYGKDPVGYYSTFKDVSQDKWYADAIGYMQKEEIFGGYSDDTFKPESSITRAEFASVISKFTKSEKNYSAIEFKDVKKDFWGKEYIDAVTSMGYMKGRSADKFYPEDPITRTEVATVLNKILKREPNILFMNKYSQKDIFKDVDEDFWGYYEILEISGN